MITRKQAQQIVTELINQTFAGYTVSVADMKAFANDVLNTAYNGHNVVFAQTVHATFAAKVNEHFGMNV